MEACILVWLRATRSALSHVRLRSILSLDRVVCVLMGRPVGLRTEEYDFF
jgi:hypothetical protein